MSNADNPQPIEEQYVFEIPSYVGAMQALFPQAEANQLITVSSSAYWSKEGTVFPHHEAVFAAYASMIERVELNAFTSEDVHNTGTLLRWVAGIDPVDPHPHNSDILRTPTFKDITIYKLEQLAQLTADDDLSKNLVPLYRRLVRGLVDKKRIILPKVNVMDTHLNILRPANDMERIQLLENKIRKNASVLKEETT